MYEDRQDNQFTGFRNFVSIIVFVARAFACSVEVFLHNPGTFGSRYFGLQAGAAVLLIFFWPAFCEPHHDAEWMLCFLAWHLLFSMAIRYRTRLRPHRGEPEPHTRYSGTPRLMRFTGRMDEVKVKCMVEPLFTFLMGGLIGEVSPPVGGFLMVASAGLLVSNGLAADYERRRAADMHDAYLDQRRVVDRFRDLRRD